MSISNSENVIDSRDVIEEIEALEAQRDNGDESYDDTAANDLETLLRLAEQGEQYAADWSYGETLIRDSYFEEYAQELAEDCGMIPSDAKWPCTCIDWEKAARELRMDYTAIDFDGVTYWVR